MAFSEPVDIGAWRIYSGDYRAIEATVYERVIMAVCPFAVQKLLVLNGGGCVGFAI